MGVNTLNKKKVLIKTISKTECNLFILFRLKK